MNRYPGFPRGTSGKEPPASAVELGDVAVIPGQEDPPEEGMATHSSILAWRIPQTDRQTVHGAAKSWTQLKQPSTHTRVSEVVTLEGGCEIY